ncbi:hypothetical protein Fcan01_01743 [Folsomia candida]|uniref:Uncharacterized protein n=1 Tax=Folsomia candida TaxID=158441 RepID=A0A226F5R9_FOLCA|nr:hypothetical protein Fcan01_01743 [Folsomia candida]
MTFSMKIIYCVAIISIQFLITISARNVLNSEITFPTPQPSQDSVVEGRSFLAEISDFSGRSLIIKSLLLAPLGIALVLLSGLILLPIPVISTGRGIKNGNNAVDLVKKVITSEECVERISCEISTFTRNYEATSWIPRRIETFMKNSSLHEKISRGFSAIDKCKQFTCHPMRLPKRSDRTSTHSKLHK